MAQYVSRKYAREGAGDRDRQWRGEGERRMGRRQRGGGRAYSQLKQRGAQALNGQVTGNFWRHCPLRISAAAESNGLMLSTLRLTPRSLGDLRAEGRVQGGQERPHLALAKCSLSREEQ